MGRLNATRERNSLVGQNNAEPIVTACNNCDIWKQLCEYKKLEEQGRLIELPCAVGDTVYLIEEDCEDIYLPSTNYYYIEENPFDVWMLCGIDETVFLTKEEAEAKLKELEGE